MNLNGAVVPRVQGHLLYSSLLESSLLALFFPSGEKNQPYPPTEDQLHLHVNVKFHLVYKTVLLQMHSEPLTKTILQES